MTSRLVFHFHDGSVHDETAVYAQRGTFRLLRDHVIQKGPSFPTSLDASFDVSRGTVTLRSRKEGEPEEDAFSLGNSTIKAIHFLLHPELGGVTGLIAPLVGKEPPDMHIWTLFTDVPAFLRFEGSLYMGGPTWRIEYISPH